jgi:hypothetical protein
LNQQDNNSIIIENLIKEAFVNFMKDRIYLSNQDNCVNPDKPFELSNIESYVKNVDQMK